MCSVNSGMWASTILLGWMLSGAYGIECPYGWSTYGGFCLRNSYSRNFLDAVSICQKSGGRLFEPRSEKLSDLLQYVLSTRSDSVAWLGISNSRYVSDNQPIVFRKKEYIDNIGQLNKTGYWDSTPNGTDRALTICDFPYTNTKCATVATIFIEDSFAVQDNNACLDACASTVGCKFWTFTNGQCGLRFFEAGALVAGGVPGVTSTGFPTAIVATGGRVLVGNAVKNVKTARKCQMLCFEDPKCNSFTWTNVDKTFGGINTETCVFNYGETLRELPLPGNDAFNIVSGPRSCPNEKKNQIVEVFEATG